MYQAMQEEEEAIASALGKSLGELQTLLGSTNPDTLMTILPHEPETKGGKDVNNITDGETPTDKEWQYRG